MVLLVVASALLLLADVVTMLLLLLLHVVAIENDGAVSKLLVGCPVSLLAPGVAIAGAVGAE